MMHSRKQRNAEKDDKPIEPSDTESLSEAEEYYRDNSKELLEIVDAEESGYALTESEASELLTQRGFVGYPITFDYSIKGDYTSETEASKSSNVKHPMYMTYYVSKSNEIWVIYIIGNSVYANPLSFNLESELEAAMLISESEQLISYDDDTNKFFITIKNPHRLLYADMYDAYF